jgi:hypothetical protein
MEREKGTGPVIDEIVTKRTTNAVTQAVVSLTQEIDDIGGERNDDPAFGDHPKPRWVHQQAARSI